MKGERTVMTSTVLFLCTGNYYRSRFAEHLFNHLAARKKLGWAAESRGLRVPGGNIGPISHHTITRLAACQVQLPKEHRFPLPVCTEDLQRAALVIALKEAEHRAMVAQNFPAW